jgi:hypothetical protein
MLFASFGADAAHREAIADKIRSGFQNQRDFLWLADDIYAETISYWHCCIEKEPGNTLNGVARRRIAAGTMYFADKVMSEYTQSLDRFMDMGNIVIALTHESGKYADGTPLDQYVEYIFTIEKGKITKIDYWAVERTPIPPSANAQRNKYGDALHAAISAAAAEGYSQVDRRGRSER